VGVGDPIERAGRTRSGTVDRHRARGVIAVDGDVRRWEEVPGAQSPVLGVECDEVMAAARPTCGGQALSCRGSTSTTST
jgi:hypothetical protein